MTFNELMDYIDNSYNYGTIPGTERVVELLKELGSPQNNLKVIHVAGTNGKGSTTAMISAVLTEAGYKTGMYISPHLYTMCERMSIDGQMISEEDMIKVSEVVLEKVELIKKRGGEPPTHFELITAIALYYFFLQKVSFVVLEVGLGGRYDATNVVLPLLSVITSISFDHMDYLGDTIEKIAFEKAGIIKKDVPVVVYPQRYEAATKVIEDVARENHAKVINVPRDCVKYINHKNFTQVISYQLAEHSYQDVELNLLGEYQLLNGAVAITAIGELQKQGFNISEGNIRAGLRKVVWPCRFSIVQENPLILIDGAHNSDGIDALKISLKKYFSNYKIIGITGMLADKDFNYVAKEMAPILEKCITLTPNGIRALPGLDLAEVYRRENCKNVKAAKSVDEALQLAKDQADEKTLICIFGSLYLTGEIYHIIKSN